MHTSKSAPMHAWAILAIAVLAVSSAGAVFRTMDGIEPLLKAGWRLQATSLVLLPFFIYQLRTSDFQWDRRILLIVLGSSICLWIHFGSWVWSLDHTSLTHSLLFVTAHPLVIVAGMIMLRMNPHRWEIIGAILGFTGAFITLQDAKSGGEVTLLGDAAAFVGALAIVGYLAAGRVLRSEDGMPLFLYAFPVTAMAAIFLTIQSILQEGTTLEMSTVDTSAIGWADPTWLLPVAYLALGPGLAGHTGINASLKWLPPLVISVAVVLEPLIGSLLGWAIGVESVPGMWTWFGGPFMVVGTALAIIGSHHRLTQEANAHGEE
ncbi:MAG: DMT family transporter [Candidatus Thermoplasmatota archaeon]|nr:DMT family transporter [Candidatus Thermoplasmatota archaeon]